MQKCDPNLLYIGNTVIFLRRNSFYESYRIRQAWKSNLNVIIHFIILSLYLSFRLETLFTNPTGLDKLENQT